MEISAIVLIQMVFTTTGPAYYILPIYVDLSKLHVFGFLCSEETLLYEILTALKRKAWSLPLDPRCGVELTV